MLTVKGELLYVGKAKNLKKRVNSYFDRRLNARLSVMIAQVANIEIIMTHSESEALLLENNLIKTLKPRYNVLLRDDKSYPYILVSTEHPYPSMELHRGTKKSPGRYFGPYPNVGAVKESLQLLQKMFHIRQCRDSYFQHRKRPCLQYQIKRCSAPCVDLIDKESYAQDIAHAMAFLEGRGEAVIAELGEKMEAASTAQEYEKAGHFRDQIISLRRAREHQCVDKDEGNWDIVGLYLANGGVCVSVLFIRQGRLLGHKAYFPKTPADCEANEIMTAFLKQYYLAAAQRDYPDKIVISHPIESAAILMSVVQSESQQKIALHQSPRGNSLRWMNMAINNAKYALESRQAEKATTCAQMQQLAKLLMLSRPPLRIECFDISHTQGEATVGSCVVFEASGPNRKAYRRFNIKGIVGGDDYAAMEQALIRRYKNMTSEDMPDILLIDGGKGQLAKAQQVLNALKRHEILVLGVVKGEGRKAENDRVLIAGESAPIAFEGNEAVLRYLQAIRDEAHRFAITGHRKQRAKKRNQSILEGVLGVGPNRRRLLLNHFGGLQEIKRASIEELERVSGINRALAQRIYDELKKI